MMLPHLVGEVSHEFDGWQRDRLAGTQADAEPNPCPFQREIDALLIEVNGIIYDDTHWWRWLTRTVAHLGVPTRFEPFYRHWEQDYLPKVCCEGLGFWEALEQQLLDCGLSPGTCNELLTAARSRRRCLDNGVRTLPDILPTLAELTVHEVELVALANRPSTAEEFHACLERLGVAAFFDRWHTSLELGRSIATPAALRQIVDRMGVRPARAVFLSSCETHREAARRTGLLTAGYEGPHGHGADLQLERFRDLVSQFRLRESRREAA
jgi:FMN phosphatase YigB (HAD superfamily)